MTIVGEADFERELELVRVSAAGAVAGVFGPRSVCWRVDREAAIFLGAGRALLLQLAHPAVAAAIAEHSMTFADPIGRFQRTFGTVFTMVFGSLDQALAAARRLHRRHAAIRGVLPQSGASYCANEVAALVWVHASLTETALLAYALVQPPLSEAERERYWRESRLCAGLFGIPQSALPADWAGFAAYCERMQQSLAVGAGARRIVGELLGRAHLPRWYRAVTAGSLPARLREDFGLSYREAEAQAAARALARLRRVYPALPRIVRHVGPYREAAARLAGRRPGIAAALGNRLWIGRPRMPPP
jgi:uncharacterized protein (DUF2236 family)